jgi:hypothetical protein
VQLTTAISVAPLERPQAFRVFKIAPRLKFGL